MTNSACFDRFLASFINPSDVRDGLDIEAIYGLTDREKQRAEVMLLEQLQKQDCRAIVALGELKSTQALIQLKAWFQEVATGRHNLRLLLMLAVALWQIEPQPQYLDEVAYVLKKASFWGDRMEAAIALRHFKHPSVKPLIKVLLKEGLQDENSLVRCHSATSLLMLIGLCVEENTRESLPIRIMNDDSSIQSQAYQELCALLETTGLNFGD